MPGTSGLLTPFGKMDGLYFDNADEPDSWAYDMAKKSYQHKLMHDEDGTYIRFQFDDPNEYYDCLLRMKNFNDGIVASGTSKEGEINVVVEDELSLDEATAAIPH